MGKKETKLISVRVPYGLAESMSALAERNQRSVNGEIVNALRQYVGAMTVGKEARNEPNHEQL